MVPAAGYVMVSQPFISSRCRPNLGLWQRHPSGDSRASTSAPRSMTDKASPLRVGQVLIGSLFNEPMRVETVQPTGHASWVVGLVGANSERFRKVTISAEDVERLTLLDP